MTWSSHPTNLPNLRSFNANVVQDEYKGRWALLADCMPDKAAKNEIVVVVANDMPFHKSWSAGIYALSLSSTTDVVIPFSRGATNHFMLFIGKTTCLPAIENAILNQEKRIISWFDFVTVLKIEGTKLLNLDPEGLAFVNINTPDDLKLVEKAGFTLDPLIFHLKICPND